MYKKVHRMKLFTYNAMILKHNNKPTILQHSFATKLDDI